VAKLVHTSSKIVRNVISGWNFLPALLKSRFGFKKRTRRRYADRILASPLIRIELAQRSIAGVLFPNVVPLLGRPRLVRVDVISTFTTGVPPDEDGWRVAEPDRQAA
jgi:hypothetical protein